MDEADGVGKEGQGGGRVKLVVKTGDGRVLNPTLTVAYECNGCGHINELVRLNGKGNNGIDLSDMEHDSLCYKCESVEIISFGVEE